MNPETPKLIQEISEKWSELFNWQEKNKATVGWNDRCGAFIVQRKDQTVGHIGIGSTPSEAIRDAMKEGK